jgi:hypothetical protein
MTTFKQLGSLILGAMIVPAVLAESHCPGNVESLHFRLLVGDHIVVPVYVNHSGPYGFLVDTGTRTTMIGASLADELHLVAHGDARVAGLGFREPAFLTQLDLLEAGSHAVEKLRVLVYGQLNLRSVDPHIRGILGEDFLEHFDMLFDNAHRLLCLDDTSVMRMQIRGTRIGLLVPVQQADLTSSNLLVIVARLSGEPRPVRLMLDSGANVPYLFRSSQHVSQVAPTLVWSGPNGDQKILSALLPQEVKIASLEFPQITFFTLKLALQDTSNREFDGCISLNLFRSVFISHTNHFAVLQPR